MDVPVFANQQKLIYMSSVDTGGCLEDLTKAIDESDRWRESLGTVLSLWFDDDDCQ